MVNKMVTEYVDISFDEPKPFMALNIAMMKRGFAPNSCAIQVRADTPGFQRFAITGYKKRRRKPYRPVTRKYRRPSWSRNYV